MQNAPLDVSGRNVDTSLVLNCRLFAVSQTMFLLLMSVLGGMNVACQRRYWWSLFAKASEQLGCL